MEDMEIELTKKIWKIRAEIIGEFVTTYEFDNEDEAKAKYSKLVCDSIYTSIEVWEMVNKVEFKR